MWDVKLSEFIYLETPKITISRIWENLAYTRLSANPVHERTLRGPLVLLQKGRKGADWQGQQILMQHQKGKYRVGKKDRVMNTSPLSKGKNILWPICRTGAGSLGTFCMPRFAAAAEP